jgi:hypothetical protein
MLLLWSGFMVWNTFRTATRNMYGTSLATSAAVTETASMGGVGMSSFERMVMSRRRQVLRNDDVVGLAHEGISNSLIIALLRDSDAAFDLTPAGIVKLRRAGIEELVITTMLERNRLQAANPIP